MSPRGRQAVARCAANGRADSRPESPESVAPTRMRRSGLTVGLLDRCFVVPGDQRTCVYRQDRVRRAQA